MTAPKSAAERAGERMARLLTKLTAKHAVRPAAQRAGGLTAKPRAKRAAEIASGLMAKLKAKLKAKLAAERSAKKRERVFMNELGVWPKVFHVGANGENRYLVEYEHESPCLFYRPSKIAKRIFWVTFLLLAALALVSSWEGGLVSAFFISAVIWLFARPICNSARKRTLKMEIQNGTVSWNAPNGDPCHIAVGQIYQSVVVVPHRLAAEQARLVDEDIRRGIIKSHQKVQMTFQIASEVVIHTGVKLQFRSCVAEISNDRHGEIAHILKAAIDYVIEYSRDQVRIADAERRSTVRGATGSGLYD